MSGDGWFIGVVSHLLTIFTPTKRPGANYTGMWVMENGVWRKVLNTTDKNSRAVTVSSPFRYILETGKLAENYRKRDVNGYMDHHEDQHPQYA